MRSRQKRSRPESGEAGLCASVVASRATRASLTFPERHSRSRFMNRVLLRVFPRVRGLATHGGGAPGENPIDDPHVAGLVIRVAV